MKLISVLFILLSFPTFAQEKGAYFRLGQTILATSGTSYSNLEDNIYANEVAATACMNKLNKLAFQAALRERDLKDCNEISKRVFPKPDNTGFLVSDFFGVGCNGNLKKVYTFYHHGKRKEETIVTEHKFESRYESNNLRFRNLDSNANDHNRLDIPMPDEFNRELVTLNLTYTRKPRPSGYASAEWDFQYKISEGSDKKINVEYVLDSIPSRDSNTNANERTKITVNCISHTLDEMNEIAKMYEN